MIAEKLNLTREVQNADELGQTQAIPVTRDDDTHYFESYGANGRIWIHENEISDSIAIQIYMQ